MTAWLLVPLVCLVGCGATAGRGDGRIAVIGEGVIGLSTATAILDIDPNAKIDIYHHIPFEQALSKHIAGLFRVDSDKPIHRLYGNETFTRLASLWRQLGGASGVQMLSGHILSHDRSKLEMQERAYSDIVYNFRWLSEREKESQFEGEDNVNSSCIHYTAFTSEGARYCPYMKKELIAKGVTFYRMTIDNFQQLADLGYPVVVNCAGLEGGQLAGDSEVFPIRGILLKTNATWHKHFLYRDFITYSIPVIDAVYLGGVKQDGEERLTVEDSEVEDILGRYRTLQPAFKSVTPSNVFVGLRPGRGIVRVEKEDRLNSEKKNYKLVHNYGHGGAGFTYGWGTAQHAAALVFDKDVSRYEEALRNSL